MCSVCTNHSMYSMYANAFFCSKQIFFLKFTMICIEVRQWTSVYILKGALRLVNGADGYYGRVEIHHNGIWGTICIDDFNDKVADVICRQLNLR